MLTLSINDSIILRRLLTVLHIHITRDYRPPRRVSGARVGCAGPARGAGQDVRGLRPQRSYHRVRRGSQVSAICYIESSLSYVDIVTVIVIVFSLSCPGSGGPVTTAGSWSRQG